MALYNLVYNYSPVGDAVSLVTSFILLIIIRLVLFYARDNKFEYLKMALHFIMVGSTLNICFYYYVQSASPIAFFVFLIRDAYHACFVVCLYLFILYFRKLLDVNGKEVLAFTYFTRFFAVFCLVMDFLSPFTKVGFHRLGNYWFDPMSSPYNAFYLYAVALLIAMPWVYPNRMIRAVRMCLVATEVVIAAIMVRGAIQNTNTLTSFTYLLPIMVVMVLLHSKPFDDVTGALSEDSFHSVVGQYAKKGISVDYMVLQLNLDVVGKLPTELGKVLNSFWHDDFRNALLFQLEHNVFVLPVPRVRKNGNTETKIKALIANDFPKYYAEYQIPYKVLGLFDVDYAHSNNDVMTMINYLLMTVKENSITFSDEKMEEQLKLLLVVKENLIDIEKKNDLNDPRVLTYCQPIKNMVTDSFDTAEALMRLEIPGEGLVMPYIFIPLAEHYGYIHTLTKIMLNKVCMQVKLLEEEGYRFKRISINFAASEIKGDRFCTEILSIIRQNDVSPSKIGIELTETQNETDLKIVKDKMSFLRRNNMTLYLDDVGTGYSNLDRIVRYDVDVVKFDRFFLLEAESNPKVALMMKHLSEAFKELNYTLLYEGVESEENEKLCLECGAEYIQGFKYSKPVPIDNIRNFFEKEQN